jgi:hypothetical protein
MNTTEHPDASTHVSPAEQEGAHALADPGSSGVVLLSFGPLGTLWPVAFVALVAFVLVIAVPGLILAAAVFALFAGPYLLIRRAFRDR